MSPTICLRASSALQLWALLLRINNSYLAAPHGPAVFTYSLFPSLLSEFLRWYVLDGLWSLFTTITKLLLPPILF